MRNNKESTYWISAGFVAMLLIISLMYVLMRNGARKPSLVAMPISSKSGSGAKKIEEYEKSAEFLKELGKATSELDGRIEFYGKVIDHHGVAVTGAQVKYITATSNQIWSGNQYSVSETSTDQKGAFSITSNRGSSLSIEWIKKEGYRFATGGKVFSYNYGRSGPDAHRPDLQRPVQFLMIPNEFDYGSVIRPLAVDLRFNWNSDPIKVPIGATGEVLILHPTRDMREGERKGFSWNVKIEIENGTLLMREKGDNLPFAPLEGYQKEVNVGRQRGEADWGGALIDREFLFRSSNGCYGRARVDIYAKHQDGDIGASVICVYNPTGERFLD